MNKVRISSILLVVASVFLFVGCTTTSNQRTASSDVSIEYNCPVCDTGFITEADWIQHVKDHHPKKMPVVAKMMKTKNPDRPKIEFGCPVCDTGFMSPKEWKDYSASSSNGKKMISPKVRLKKTIRDQGQVKSLYACPICDTGFVSEREWRDKVMQGATN